MKIQSWIDEININQLPQPYQSLASQIGLEYAMIIAEEFGGTHVYFPKLDTVIRDARDTKIKKEFNGRNYKELARKYNLTEIWVRKIVAPIDGSANQTNLYNFLDDPETQ